MFALKFKFRGKFHGIYTNKYNKSQNSTKTISFVCSIFSIHHPWSGAMFRQYQRPVVCTAANKCVDKPVEGMYVILSVVGTVARMLKGWTAVNTFSGRDILTCCHKYLKVFFKYNTYFMVFSSFNLTKTALTVLSWQTCSGIHVLTVLSGQPCPGSPALLSCP